MSEWCDKKSKGTRYIKNSVDRLWVLEKNIDAIDFYKAYGFIESGEKQFVEGTEEIEILLVREV